MPRRGHADLPSCGGGRAPGSGAQGKRPAVQTCVLLRSHTRRQHHELSAIRPHLQGNWQHSTELQPETCSYRWSRCVVAAAANRRSTDRKFVSAAAEVGHCSREPMVLFHNREQRGASCTSPFQAEQVSVVRREVVSAGGQEPSCGYQSGGSTLQRCSSIYAASASCLFVRSDMQLHTCCCLEATAVMQCASWVT